MGDVYILGLCIQTDSSAALLKNGQIVAAIEEERFTRVKYQHGYPEQSVRFCLQHAGISFADVDYVALYWKPWRLLYRLFDMIKYLIFHPTLFVTKIKRGTHHLGGDWKRLITIRRWLKEKFGPGKYRYLEVEHHLTHAATCFLLSGFEEAAILTLDGVGESTTTLLAYGEGTNIRKLKEIRLPNSLGHFYSAMTGYLGFKMLEHEYKVMGMAAGGTPKYAELMSEKALVPRPPDNFTYRIDFIDYHAALNGQFTGSILKHLGPARKPDQELTSKHFDIAASAQKAVETIGLQLAQHLQRLTGSKNICIAGGVGLNCVMNGLIIDQLPYEHIYVPPCCHDAGGALGAAVYTHYVTLGNRRDPACSHLINAALGQEFSSEECESALKREDELQYTYLPDEILIPRLAKELAAGNIVGWFNGRSEYGPRALGNRSFLADPRRKEIREILNVQVKRRELFRPFAPSVKAEYAKEYFGRDAAVEFMTLVCDVPPEKRRQIPAVVHLDGSARPQAVSRETNPRYWNLIDAFEKKTKIPVILNTSFNIQEPIVNSPQDAIDCFKRCSVKYMAMENFLVWKKNRK
jgi:carbamoyltransferase